MTLRLRVIDMGWYYGEFNKKYDTINEIDLVDYFLGYFRNKLFSTFMRILIFKNIPSRNIKP